jgi:hypothetical protein
VPVGLREAGRGAPMSFVAARFEPQSEVCFIARGGDLFFGDYFSLAVCLRSWLVRR